MAEQDTEYEQLVARILQGMLNYDGFENLRVEHDVRIVGKSGAAHQIDVFWEFKAAGVTYRTCVECKNYNSPVKKLHIASFAEVIRDIGNANGIFATTSSYQKGAKLLAAENNIRLVLVNHLIRTVHIKSTPKLTRINDVRLSFNQNSVRDGLLRNNLEKYQLSYDLSGDHPLLDCEGNTKETFNTFINKQPKKSGKNVLPAKGLFVNFEGFGAVELEAVTADVSYIDLPMFENIIDIPGTAEAALEDIIDNNIHYLHQDGQVNNEP